MSACFSMQCNLSAEVHHMARQVCCSQAQCLAARYKSLVYDTPSHLPPRAPGAQPRAAAALEDVRTVRVHVRGDSAELSLDIDESYTLTVGTGA